MAVAAPGRFFPLLVLLFQENGRVTNFFSHQQLPVLPDPPRGPKGTICHLPSEPDCSEQLPEMGKMC